MRRILLFSAIGFILVALIIVVVTLAGRRQPAQTQKPTKQPVVLTIWRYGDESSAFDNLIEQFKTELPDIQVEYVKKEFKDYELEATNALASGKGPDIWSIPNSWLSRHQDKLVPAPDGVLRRDKEDRRSNTKIVQDRYVPIVTQEVIKDNKVYGLPYSVDTLALYVSSGQVNQIINDKSSRNEQLDKILFSDGPRTWDELVTFVKTLTVRTKDQVKTSAIAMGTGSNVEVAPHLLAAIMMQNRTQMISPDGLTAGFNLPAKKSTGAEFNPGKEAVDFYTAFANPAKEVFSWMPSMPDSQKAFLDGKTMMVFGYSDLEKTIRQFKPDLKYRVIPLPQISGSRQAIDFAWYPVETVTNNAENPEVAWSFIRFVSTSGLSHYLSATRRPSPLKIEEPPQTVLERITFGSPFKFQQQTALAWDRGKNPDSVEQVFRQMADEIITRGVSTQVALDSAAKQVTEILRKAAEFEPRAVEGQ